MTTASDTFTLATTDGLLTYRDTRTEGRPLVLLHTYFTDHHMFDEQMNFFAERYRVIAPDARGHGASANASEPFRQTDDLAALLRHLDLGPAVLVGVSMGAMIALDTALEHPELVHAVVVSGRGLADPDLSDPWSQALQAAMAEAMAAGDIARWVDGQLGWAVGPHRSLDGFDPELAGRLREMIMTTLVKHTPDEPNHLVKVADAEARVKEIAVPVLAVNGALDAQGLLDTVDQLMAAVPDNRGTVVLDGAGHYPNMERPAEFNRVVGEFLDSVYAQQR